MDKNLFIEELLFYAKVNFEIKDECDLIYLRNTILGELNLDYFEEVKLSNERKEEILSFNTPDYFVLGLTTYFKSINLDEEEIKRKIDKIFGFLH